MTSGHQKGYKNRRKKQYKGREIIAQIKAKQ